MNEVLTSQAERRTSTQWTETSGLGVDIFHFHFNESVALQLRTKSKVYESNLQEVPNYRYQI